MTGQYGLEISYLNVVGTLLAYQQIAALRPLLRGIPRLLGLLGRPEFQSVANGDLSAGRRPVPKPRHCVYALSPAVLIESGIRISLGRGLSTEQCGKLLR